MVVVGISATFFYYPLHILFVLSTLAGCGSLLGEVTQNFIPEGSGPLVVLPGLGCCSFLLTLITGHGSTMSYLKGLPIFQTYSFLPSLFNNQSSLLLVIRIPHTSQ